MSPRTRHCPLHFRNILLHTRHVTVRFRFAGTSPDVAHKWLPGRVTNKKVGRAFSYGLRMVAPGYTSLQPWVAMEAAKAMEEMQALGTTLVAWTTGVGIRGISLHSLDNLVKTITKARRPQIRLWELWKGPATNGWKKQKRHKAYTSFKIYSPAMMSSLVSSLVSSQDNQPWNLQRQDPVFFLCSSRPQVQRK